MIDRIKNWLGIEGVKIHLELPDTIRYDSGVIDGLLEFSTLREQEIQSIKFSLIETYRRGRGKEKRIDDHILAHEAKNVSIHITENSTYVYPFSISFTTLESRVDKLSHNSLLKPFAGTLKWLNAAHSDYTLNVSVKVKGNKLNPHIKKEIEFK